MVSYKLFFSLLCSLSAISSSLSASQDLNSLESVPDLENSMYADVAGYPCVRLLSLSGEIGCANPGREKVVVPPIRFSSADKLSQLSAILVPLNELESLFHRISTDLDFAKHVGGVLVESGPELGSDFKGFSPDEKFPLAEFSPYPKSKYQWNPTGSGIMWKNYNFPVYLLLEGSSSTLSKVAIQNEGKQKAYTEDVVEFDVVMQTTKEGTRDTTSCLLEETCLPLGGYSVLSALPPISKLSTESKHIILAMASMDSASLFRDKNLGADSHLSGLISLLVAVDALSRFGGLSELNKQLVFVFFTGEAWGYLGSRRFLLELDEHSDSLDGLSSTLIDTVVEVGSVGKGFRQGVNSFFAHTTQTSAATNKTLDALKLAQNSLHSVGEIKVSTANASNPGMPPSSLMTFLKKNPQISGFVLEDFDTSFTNQFYHSHLDVFSNINPSSIMASASLVARTLYILASDKKDVNTTALNSININGTLTEDLIDCLLTCDPGLSCDLLKQYISPSTKCPSHYVGVVLGEPSFAPYAGYVNDVPRFLWNFLAEKTSVPSKNADSSCPKNCSSVGESCIKVESDGKGVCVVSSTRYVPAYSTRLKFESGTWKVLEPNSSDPMGMVDPVWTESNWNALRLRVYTRQYATYDLVVLLGGIMFTVLAYIAILFTRAFITKALKRD